MKRFLLSLCSFLTITLSFAQLEPVVTGLINPVGLAFDGNELYISVVGESKIVKIDVSQPNPTPIDVLTNISFPGYMEVVGNELYFTKLSGTGTLSKINLSNNNPVEEIIVSGLSQPFGIARNGNDFYISTRSQGTIVKIDISQPNPIPTIVITGLGLNTEGLALDGNTLYIARGGDQRVSRIDITQTNPILEDIILDFKPLDVVVEGGYLYISGFVPNQLNGKVSRLNLTQPDSVVTDLLTNITTPWGIKVKGTDVYFAQQEDGQISKLDLNLYNDPTSSSDYSALEALYTSTNGDNWTNNTNWMDVNQPLNTWFGLTLENNRVKRINLGDNNLTGTIPNEIGNFSEITYLGLYGNQITGTVPPEIGNLSNLIELDLSPNTLSGTIPPEIGNLINLEILWLNQNGLTGSIPQSFQNLVNLRELYLRGATGSPFLSSTFSGDFPDLTGLPLTVLELQGNYFEFSDMGDEFDSYVNNIPTFTFSPQYTLDTAESIAQLPGTTITLTITDIESRTTQNRRAENSYQWYKDTVEIAGATENTYTITNAQVEDSGIYYCSITNIDFSGFEIKRAPITVIIDPNLSITQSENQVIKIFPNPVKNWLTINLGNHSNAKIELNSVDGKLIWNQTLHANTNTIDISTLENGIYVLTITSAEKNFIKRIIKH